MSTFLTTKAALAELERIIDRAVERIVLLSPYLSISENYRARLLDADRRGVPITLVYGKRTLDSTELRRTVGGFRGLRLLYSAPLHAKCYFNERSMVITSLNLLQGSEQNWEMGIALEANEPAFGEAKLEAERIIEHASRVDAPASAEGRPGAQQPVGVHNVVVSQVRRSAPQGRRPGHCIRCATHISFNPDAPYCGACYSIWAQYGNWEYEEQVCHRCGRAEATTRARPQCHACYVTEGARF